MFIPGTRLLTPEAYYKSTYSQPRYVRKVDGPFELGIAKGQRKRIAKCERLGYFFCEADIDSCYWIVRGNRIRKGHVYSMEREDWNEMATHTNAVKCFAVKPGPVAVAMCVLLTAEVLYVQAWADIEGQEQNSPVVFLCRGIYEWCQDSGIRELDIGIANEPSLIRFKESLGFKLREIS